MGPRSFSSDHDIELVTAHLTGCETAFARIYERYYPSVVAVCRQRLRDPKLAEDLAQEAFLKAMGALGSFREGNLGAWLRRIAINLCIDHLRSAAVRRESVTATMREEVDPSTDPAQRTESRVVVADLLGGLSLTDAALLVERHVEGRSLKQMATARASTSGSVGVAVHRAMKRVRASARSAGYAVIPAPLLQWFQELGARTANVVGALQFGAVAIPLAIVVAVVAPPVAQPAVPVGAPLVAEVKVPVGMPSPAAAVGVQPSDATPVANPPSSTEQTSPPGTEGTIRPAHATEPTYREEAAVGDVLSVGEGDPATPDYRYGVRAETGGQEADVFVEAWDEPEQEPVHETGCTAMAAGEPVTFCEGAAVD